VAIAVDIDLRGVNAEQYAQMLQHLGASLTSAPGFLSHDSSPAETGWRIRELWRSEADWARFAEDEVAPLAEAAGITLSSRVVPLHRLLTPLADASGRSTGPGLPAAPLLSSDEGEAFRLGPLQILVKEDGTHTRQMLAVAEFRGTTFRIPPHVHTEHDESIYVLEGELGVRLGDETFVARQGASFTIPIGAVHSVWNESGAPARFLNTIVPARYLDYFHELGMAAGVALPPIETIQEIMGRYGLRTAT